MEQKPKNVSPFSNESRNAYVVEHLTGSICLQTILIGTGIKFTNWLQQSGPVYGRIEMEGRLWTRRFW